MKQCIVIVLCLLTISSLKAQTQREGRTKIKIGVKKPIDDTYVGTLIQKRQYNYLDAFEYELGLMLDNYLEMNTNFEADFIEVPQAEREEYIQKGLIDALMFSFSKTYDREKLGIYFSAPYLQNKALVMVSNSPDISVQTLGKKEMSISFIANSTGSVVKNIRDEYRDYVKVDSVPDYAALIERLRNRDTDAIVGDITRLAYDLSSNEFFLGGNLPDSFSKVRDNYCIAVNSNHEELVKVFNAFLTSNREAIKDLESKWLSTTIEEAYQEYYNRNYIDLNNELYIVIGVLALVLFILVIYGVGLLRKRDARFSELNSKIDEQVNMKLITMTMGKFENVLEEPHIIKNGIELFDSARKGILYVGSGGFLSSQNENSRNNWSESAHRCMQKTSEGGEFVFRRVVDLPDLDMENKRFRDIESFDLKTDISDYLPRYISWLLVQYHDLISYKNFELIESRGAPLWGYGMVMILCDEEKGIMFTTDKYDKKGTYLVNHILVRNLSKGIQSIVELGQRITPEIMKNRFFVNSNECMAVCTEIEKEAKANPGQRVSESVRAKISEASELFTKRFLS